MRGTKTRNFNNELRSVKKMNGKMEQSEKTSSIKLKMPPVLY